MTTGMIRISGNDFQGQQTNAAAQRRRDGDPAEVLENIANALALSFKQAALEATRFKEIPRNINPSQLCGNLVGAAVSAYGMEICQTDVNNSWVGEFNYLIDLNYQTIRVCSNSHSRLDNKYLLPIFKTDNLRYNTRIAASLHNIQELGFTVKYAEQTMEVSV